MNSSSPENNNGSGHSYGAQWSAPLYFDTSDNCLCRASRTEVCAVHSHFSTYPSYDYGYIDRQQTPYTPQITQPSNQAPFSSPTSSMTSPSPTSAHAAENQYPGINPETLAAGEGVSASPRRFCDVPGCGKSYTAQHNLDYHKRVHEGTKPFRCNKCQKDYRSRSDLKRHSKSKSHRDGASISRRY